MNPTPEQIIQGIYFPEMKQWQLFCQDCGETYIDSDGDAPHYDCRGRKALDSDRVR